MVAMQSEPDIQVAGDMDYEDNSQHSDDSDKEGDWLSDLLGGVGSGLGGILPLILMMFFMRR
jgi:hypothetical protein